MNNIHTKPITVGELEYLKELIQDYVCTLPNNDNVTEPDFDDFIERTNESIIIIDKILEFEEVENDSNQST